MLRVIALDGPAIRSASAEIGRFHKPALVICAADDRVMPGEHGHRLAGLLPNGRHVEIPDSYTLIPLDNPALLVAAISEFLDDT